MAKTRDFRTKGHDSNPQLTPAQQATLDLIRLPSDDRLTHPSTLSSQIEAELEQATADLVDRLDEPLWISKRQLHAVNSCEALHEAQAVEPFVWRIPMTRGQIFHKCIELSVHLWPKRSATDLVDEAIASIIGHGDGLAEFLTSLSEVELAEIRSEVTALIQTFFDTFPPLRSGWHPTTELPRKVLLHRGKIVLQGRFDLTVGRPEELTAGRVVIELKTGRSVPHHLDDLRFYALLETLVVGVPPALIASFYVDAGRVQVEHVDEDLLRAATLRTTRGIERLVELRLGETQALKRPSGACKWCPVAESCAPGQAWLGEAKANGAW
ncbi:MAG: PD-(D/E)XK nuclease family protein [Actinomycetota bacterium]|nr:PD-(D/E)XK nuclease family protein [Actinomycetota bacterium]